MASSTPHTILLEINGGERKTQESLAAASITPGDVIDRASATTVQGATTTNSPGPLAVAIEAGWADVPTTPAIDHDNFFAE